MSKRPDSENELLIRYLLDEVTESEAGDLEEDLISDEELDERLHLVEMDMVDRYVRGEMEPGDRNRFENGYLRSPENQLKVEDAQLFHRSLQRFQNEASAWQPLVHPPPTRNFLQRYHVLPAALGFAALVLLLLAVPLISFLTSKPPFESDQAKAPVSVPTPAPPGQTLNQYNQSAKPSAAITPTFETQPRPKKTRNDRGERPQEEWLAAPEGNGLMGGSVPIKLLPKYDSLRLKVALLEDAQNRQTFRVTIKDEEHQIRSATLRPTQMEYNGRVIKIIFFDVPVAELTGGKSYEFAIAGLGSLRFTIER